MPQSWPRMVHCSCAVHFANTGQCRTDFNFNHTVDIVLKRRRKLLQPLLHPTSSDKLKNLLQSQDNSHKLLLQNNWMRLSPKQCTCTKMPPNWLLVIWTKLPKCILVQDKVISVYSFPSPHSSPFTPSTPWNQSTNWLRVICTKLPILFSCTTRQFHLHSVHLHPSPTLHASHLFLVLLEHGCAKEAASSFIEASSYCSKVVEGFKGLTNPVCYDFDPENMEERKLCVLIHPLPSLLVTSKFSNNNSAG